MDWHIRFLLSAVLLAPFSAYAASCSSKPETFDIVPLPMAAALERFEKQTRCHLYVDPVLLENRSTPALVGRYTPGQALRFLVGPAGLEAVRGMEGFMLHPGSYEPSQHRSVSD